MSVLSRAVPAPAGERERPTNAVRSSRKPISPISNSRTATPFTLKREGSSRFQSMTAVSSTIVSRRMTIPTVKTDICSTDLWLAT